MSAFLSYGGKTNSWYRIYDFCGLGLEEESAKVRAPLCLWFLDVGQGDCSLVKAEKPGGGYNYILIDAGEAENAGFVMNFIRESGAKSLDCVVATHPHSDHIGALPYILRHIPVKKLILPELKRDAAQENLEDIARKRGISLYYVSGGRLFSEAELSAKQAGEFSEAQAGEFSEAQAAEFSAAQAGEFSATQADGTETLSLSPFLRMEILGPLTESENMNDNSVVIRLRYKDFSALFTGDCESFEEYTILSAALARQADTAGTEEKSEQSENAVRKPGPEGCGKAGLNSKLPSLLSCDILKVGHHGSSSSTTSDFLKAAAPKAAVISCGKDNEFGHPHAAVLRRLRKSGAAVFRTDLEGTLSVLSDGEKILDIRGLRSRTPCAIIFGQITRGTSAPSGAPGKSL